MDAVQPPRRSGRLRHASHLRALACTASHAASCSRQVVAAGRCAGALRAPSGSSVRKSPADAQLPSPETARLASAGHSAARPGASLAGTASRAIKSKSYKKPARMKCVVLRWRRAGRACARPLAQKTKARTGLLCARQRAASTPLSLRSLRGRSGRPPYPRPARGRRRKRRD